MTRTQRALRTDGEATYNRILEAAGNLFASVGFAEATNKMIAAQAEVDLASINYHFGSRNGLYQAVLVEAHRRLLSVDNLQRLVSTDLPARAKLRKLIEGLVVNAIAGEGWHATVLSREFLAPSSHLQTLQTTEIPAKLPFVLGILSEITAIPAGHPSLLRCLVSVMAPCAMLLVVGPNISPFAAEIHRMTREDLVEHLYNFAIGGLAAVGRDRIEDVVRGNTSETHGTPPGLGDKP